MTEEEAKDRICCNDTAGHWRDDGPAGAGFYCRGSACMAWRWTYASPPENQIGPSNYAGHCGLAGRP